MTNQQLTCVKGQHKLKITAKTAEDLPQICLKSACKGPHDALFSAQNSQKHGVFRL